MLRIQLCTVGFYLAFRFNKFIQIPSNPLIEFVPHGKPDTVCLSKCRNVFSPSECIVSGAGQLKVCPQTPHLQRSQLDVVSYGTDLEIL